MGPSLGHLNFTPHALTPITLRVFHLPYPLSTRCEVPNEDPTNRGFCRPLPVDLFPIPVLPEMPREGQSALVLEWLLVAFTKTCLTFSSWDPPMDQSKGTPGKRVGQATA